MQIMSEKLVLVGASGHGRVIADIAKKIGYSDIAFLDDNEAVMQCAGYPVLGRTDTASRYPDRDFLVSIGNARIRQMLQKRLEQNGLTVVSLIHPSAVIGEDVTVGSGTVIMAGAVVNPGSVLAEGCIVNTCASVDHDCRIGAYAHVSVGAHVAGTVEIGQRTWIGAGATVINNIKIAADCMIGAGAVVVKDITCEGVYKGVPARRDEGR